MRIKTADGKIIDLSSSDAQVSAGDKTDKRMAASETRIKERGTIQGTLAKDVKKGGPMGGMGKAALDVASAPMNAIESSIANPALEMQRGNFNPVDLIGQAAQGATLQRQGQYGDVMKNAGFQPQVADTAGLILAMSPAKVAQLSMKTYGKIAKLSDKTISTAGKYMVNAINESRDAVGTKVQQAFQPYDRVKVDGLKFIDEFTKLPKLVQKKAESVFGNIEDYAQNLTVGRLRDFKRLIGKLSPGSWGKDLKGVAERIDDIDLDAGYSGMKKLLGETLTSKVNAKTAKYLLESEEAFNKVMLSGRHIRRTITDSILLTPTKAGNMAEKALKATADITSREALNTIKFTSKKAMGYINKAMSNQRNKEMAAHVGRAAFYGGIIAAAGSKLAKSVSDSGGSGSIGN
jgi:hypothetical protein